MARTPSFAKAAVLMIYIAYLFLIVRRAEDMDPALFT